MADKKATKKADAKAKPKAATKNVTLTKIAESTNLTKKQVGAVFDELASVIKSELSKKGPGVFTLHGLLKIKRVEKPATAARKVKDPRDPTKMIDVPAKPKRTVVRAVPLKSLKEMVK